MGKLDKTRRGQKAPIRADAKGKPRHAAGGSVVGQLSPDIVSTYFAPELIARAAEGLEKYSDELMQYDDVVRENNTDDIPPPPAAPLYRSEYWINELEEVLKDTSDHFHAKNGGWKVRAKAARFERLMDEKYGRFRPFLKEHPEVEHFVRSVQRKYATGQFSPFRQGKPPIPKSTAIVILFMMQRGNLRWEVTVLAILFFLVGLQPWALVVLVAGGHALVERRKKKPRRPMKAHIPTVEPYYPSNVNQPDEADEAIQRKAKTDMLLRPVGTKLGRTEIIDGSKYDTVILGCGPAALYPAALLSRAGRKVLVLSSQEDASGCYEIGGGPPSAMEKFKSVPFDVESSNISKISRQQILLAPALSTSTDYQGGIRFAQIGSQADGHAFEILSVPGMGTESGSSEVPFVLRANGTQSLMDDAAMSLGDGFPGLNGDISESTTGIYASTCTSINASSNEFFLSKILPEKSSSGGTYQETGIRYASAFLDQGFPLNPHCRSLMAAIGMKGENIKPSMTSMAAHVTNISSAMSGEGMHYPIGGPRALCHALATVVEQSGGHILTGVPISQLLFEEGETSTSPQSPNTDEEHEEIPPRCVGVQLGDNREVKFDLSKLNEDKFSPAVISTHGFITTFIRLLSEEIRTKYKVPRGTPALSERRPVFKVLFALEGSANDLEVTGADFYRVPGAALAQDEIDPVTGEVKFGEIGWADEAEEDSEVNVAEINEEPANPQGSEDGSSSRGKRGKTSREKSSSLPSKPKKNKRVKFETGASWMQISFPSAKDPSFQSRHGDITTCVVTIEADDDFVTAFDTKPKLFMIQKEKSETMGDLQRLMERVKRDLKDNYPQLEGEVTMLFQGNIACK